MAVAVRLATVISDELANTIDRLSRLGEDVGCEVPFMLHALPNLQRDIGAGGLGPHGGFDFGTGGPGGAGGPGGGGGRGGGIYSSSQAVVQTGSAVSGNSTGYGGHGGTGGDGGGAGRWGMLG